MRTLSKPQKFDDNYRTRVGEHGNVYKAESSTGQVVAMKKHHSLQNEDYV
jgi:hypothetical protein